MGVAPSCSNSESVDISVAEFSSLSSDVPSSEATCRIVQRLETRRYHWETLKCYIRKKKKREVLFSVLVKRLVVKNMMQERVFCSVEAKFF